MSAYCDDDITATEPFSQYAAIATPVQLVDMLVRTKSFRSARGRSVRAGAVASRLGGELENRSGSHPYRVCDRRGRLSAHAKRVPAVQRRHFGGSNIWAEAALASINKLVLIEQIP
jgi:hypothetical protein